MDVDKAAADAVAAETGARACYTESQLLADPEVQAVYIATPVFLHHDQVIAAAKAGKHVLVEKPMAMNAAECKAMIAAARENNKTLAVSFNYRWNMAPDTWYLKHLIEQGRLGQIYYIRSVSLRRRTESVTCPFCGSQQTTVRSEFGSTACKSMHFCDACHQPFERFKSF
jgi:predicted dehydrogenase